MTLSGKDLSPEFFCSLSMRRIRAQTAHKSYKGTHNWRMALIIFCESAFLHTLTSDDLETASVSHRHASKQTRASNEL